MALLLRDFSYGLLGNNLSAIIEREVRKLLRQIC